jgi:hypothetical protein
MAWRPYCTKSFGELGIVINSVKVEGRRWTDDLTSRRGRLGFDTRATNPIDSLTYSLYLIVKVSMDDTLQVHRLTAPSIASMLPGPRYKSP